MPYIWISLIVFLGMQDEVFVAAVVTIASWMVMWCCEELRAMGERVIAWDSRIVWVLNQENWAPAFEAMRGEVKP